jgi:poly(hydroxyalkanoate) depolymerase family esterase
VSWRAAAAVAVAVATLGCAREALLRPRDLGPPAAATPDLAGAGAARDLAGSDGSDGSSDGGGSSASGDGLWISGTFTSAAGQRDYKAYVPPGYRPGVPLPLVTLLHGCAVSADQMDALTRFSSLAAQRSFIVAYPIQSPLANPSLCWNWFDPRNQQRGAGEAAIIAGITRALTQAFSVDGKRIFVIGASAGGAMSVIMGATYPDLFAALGVVAGCEYGGAPCSALGGPDPLAQGRLAYQAMGAFARVVPLVVFHGDADLVAAPINGAEVVQQWLASDDYADDGQHNGSIATTPSVDETGQVAGGRGYEHRRFSDGNGAPLIDYYIIHGAGHAWPGGPAGVIFTDPGGPDATALSYDFFLSHARP